MIETIKTSLATNGYAIVNIKELFPDFKVDEWAAAMKDSWTHDKATYWTFQNMILGESDLPSNIDPSDLPERYALVEEEGLVVDQQYWNFEMDPDYNRADLGDLVHDLLLELYHIGEDEDFHQYKRVNCLGMGDLIRPQLLSDKVCQIMLCLSDVDESTMTDGQITVGDHEVVCKTGTMVIAEKTTSLGLKKVNDNQHRIICRITVNTFNPE